MDLVIRNTRLRDRERAVEVGISGERVVAIGPSLGAADRTIDAAGGLTTPGFVNIHIHLDKVMSRDAVDEVSGSFDDAVTGTIELSRDYTVEGIVERAGPVVELAVGYGTTHLRAFADIGPTERLTALEALLDLKRRYADVIDIAVVPFPQAGIIAQPGTEVLLNEAIAAGADVVGGIPWIEWTDADARRHVEICFDIAQRTGRPLHFLADETDDGTSRTLESIAVTALRSGFDGGITVSHATAMASWNGAYADKVLRLARRAGLHFACNAHENLMLMGRFDAEPVRRGIPRVNEMRALDLNVCSAQDSVADLFYPFGRMNQLEVAWALGHAIRAQSRSDMDFLYDAVTENAARAAGLAGYGLREGARADLVVLDAPSVREAIRFMGPVRYTIRAGLITAQNGRVLRRA